MSFKLVRIDTPDPCKIPLTRGTHPIGRGKFLDCPDKRVSRNHGELDVHDDSVIMKALHQNPCFYTRKGTSDTQILKKNDTVELSNGDRFGLLPDSYWYEILYCTSIDFAKDTLETNENMEETDVHRHVNNLTRIDNQSNTTQELNETGRESPSMLSDGSPSILARGESPSFTQIPESSTNEAPRDGNMAEETPTKRCHSPQDEYSIKKGKVEPEDSKQDSKPNCSRVKMAPIANDVHGQIDAGQSIGGQNEAAGRTIKVEPDVGQSNYDGQGDNPQPGPSNDQDVNKDSGSKDGMPPSPVKPQATPAQGRERCMYGANCYRKNPQHKLQFSHPRDPDWGAGERAPCPFGRGCRRRDPRHWRDHHHPPGTAPPTDPPRVDQPVAVEKRKQRARSPSSDSNEAIPEESLIVTGKRSRKPLRVQAYSGSESENEDPYQTDDSEDWKPGKDDYTQSQDFTFTQDI